MWEPNMALAYKNRGDPTMTYDSWEPNCSSKWIYWWVKQVEACALLIRHRSLDAPDETLGGEFSKHPAVTLGFISPPWKSNFFDTPKNDVFFFKQMHL